jgi:hypothetical protein
MVHRGAVGSVGSVGSMGSVGSVGVLGVVVVLPSHHRPSCLATITFMISLVPA